MRNGAGTGMDLYIAARQAQARLRALTAVLAVVLGSAALAARRLPTVTTTTRTSAATSMASALFAPRSSPIWRGGAGRRRKPYVWSRHAVLKALTQPFLRFVVNLKCKWSRGSAKRLGCSILPERICEKNF